MKMAKSYLAATILVFVWASVLVWLGTANAQTGQFDLARDWSLMGTPLKGMPFGPEYAWSVEAVQFKPAGRWEPFDRAMHFTISDPWLDLYGIDGWWLGSSPVPRKPMVGRNVGHGNIPGMVHGVDYDWPVGKVAALSWPDSDQGKGERTMTAVVWTAPRSMEVRVAGGLWMAGQYQEFADHRSRVMLWVNRASTGGDSTNEIIFQDAGVPLWTEGFDSSHPQTFAQILGSEASRLENLKMEKGDRIAVGLYWDPKATKPGWTGIDFRVTETAGSK